MLPPEDDAFWDNDEETTTDDQDEATPPEEEDVISDEEEDGFDLDLNQTSINTWYSACRPMFIDLVGDYAGRELFLLEGDSLLRECFSDERIDFQHGFQMLHAVFVVERFLESLVKRHCQFHVVFFDQHKNFCIPPRTSTSCRPRYLLARSIVIRHLQDRLPKSSGVQIYVFGSIQTKEFDEYLAASPIHFVMAHDGALPTTGKFRKEAPLDRRTKVLLRARIWWFSTHRLNVALINRVEFRDSKVNHPNPAFSKQTFLAQ
jgi:hypothetical protein